MNTQKKIRILVVDDSSLIRKAIIDIINEDEDCEVVGTAENGEEAVKSAAILKPDVITLDIELPEMNGITALKYIMSEWPTRVIMVSSFSQYQGEETLKCLEYGAVDFVLKPNTLMRQDIVSMRYELITKIKIASEVNIDILKPIIIGGKELSSTSSKISTNKVAVIASSTGGPRALVDIIPKFNPEIQAGIIVVQHMPPGFTKTMAERLNRESEISVKEAENGDIIRKGQVMVAPGGVHLTFEIDENNANTIKLFNGPKQHGVCPAADITMKSAAHLFKQNCIGIVLTGMGADGTEGLKAIKQLGGTTIAQDKNSSLIFGMPKMAINAGVVDKISPLSEISEAILKWANV